MRSRWWAGIRPAVILVALFGVEDIMVSAAWAQITPPPKSPAKGLFLVATPRLTDPNFSETVVLICEHGADGTLGLIVNRPTPVRLAEALPTVGVLKGTSYQVFWGGPVEPNGLMLLYRLAEGNSEMREVLKDVYLGGQLETIERLITHPKPRETFRAYAGYAGWAPGQLEAEMVFGSWAMVEADADTIFDKNPDLLWQELHESLTKPRVIRFDGP
jgi:putative transcriptional regulator